MDINSEMNLTSIENNTINNPFYGYTLIPTWQYQSWYIGGSIASAFAILACIYGCCSSICKSCCDCSCTDCCDSCDCCDCYDCCDCCDYYDCCDCCDCSDCCDTDCDYCRESGTLCKHLLLESLTKVLYCLKWPFLMIMHILFVHSCRTGNLRVAMILINLNINRVDEILGGSSLLTAVCYNQISIAQTLIQYGCNINVVDKTGQTPLGIAIKHRMLNMVQLLVSSECNVAAVDTNRRSLIHIAIQTCIQKEVEDSLIITIPESDDSHLIEMDILSSHNTASSGDEHECQTTSLVSLLLSKGADPNEVDVEGDTPLHTAVRQVCRDILKVLLDSYSIDLNVANNFGDTALHIACHNNDTAIVQSLLSQGAEPNVTNTSDETPLQIACCKTNRHVIRMLMRHNANPFIGIIADSSPLLTLVQDDEALLQEITEDPNKTLLGNNTLLHFACRQHVNDVQFLISIKANLDAQNDDGDTPLHIACTHDRTDITNELLCHEAMPDLINKEGNTPLHIAMMKGSLELVMLLLDTDIILDLGNKEGNTPIMIACTEKNYEIMDALLSHGADPNVINCLGESVLHKTYMYARERNDMVSLLMSRNADPNVVNNHGESLLHLACQNEDVDVATLLLANGANPNLRNNDSLTPLLVATKAKYVQLIRLLLSHQADPNLAISETGIAPLHLACSEDDSDIPAILLENNANCNIQTVNGKTPLLIACDSGRSNTAKSLLSINADPDLPNADGIYPLHFACEKGHHSLINVLLSYNANPNVRNKNGDTPIHLACATKDHSIINQLLCHKADPNLKNTDGDTPSHITCKQGNVGILTLLLAHNADINIYNNAGDTPLNIAFKMWNKELITLLMSHNARLNTANVNDNTPLHAACKEGDCKTAGWLLSQNADPNLVNNCGETPLDIVFGSNTNDIITLLLSHKADPNQVNETGECFLLTACKAENIEIVASLLSNRAETDMVDNEGNTPLLIACSNGNRSIVNLLLSYKANPDLANNEGESPLHVCYRLNHKDILEDFLAYHTNLDSINKERSTVLNLACEENDAHAVQILYESGADASIANNYGFTPLHLAAEHENETIVKILVSSKAERHINKTTRFGNTALFIACERGNTKLAELLYQYGANINISNNHQEVPLAVACVNKDSETAMWLIRVGCKLSSPDDELKTPLHKACLHGKKHIVSALLQEGASVNAADIFGCTSLHIACANKHDDIVLLLLQHGADTGSKNILGEQPLHIAVTTCAIQTVDALMQHGADVSAVKANKEAVVFSAVCRTDGYKPAKVNKARNPSSKVPASYSCTPRFDKVLMDLLIKKNVDFQVVNALGRTLLHSAVEKVLDPDLVTLLTKQGVNINSVDINKQTALHIAAIHGNINAIDVLLKHRAKLFVRDKANLLPLHYATQNVPLFCHLHKKYKSSKRKLTQSDIREVIKLSHWYNTSDQLLKLINPDKLSDNEISYQTDCGTNCRDIYASSYAMDWIKDHRQSLFHLCKYCRELFEQFATEHPIVDNETLNRCKQLEWDIVNQVLDSFVGDISEYVSRRHPIIAFTKVLSGSVGEGTKVCQPNERDYLCVLTCVKADNLITPDVPTHDKACFQLKCKENFNDIPINLLNDQGFVDKHRVFNIFHTAISEVLADPDLWDHYPQLFRHSTADIQPDNQSISHIDLIWHGHVYPQLHITMDMVPAIAFPDWQPDWCIDHQCLKEHGCHAVVKWIPGAAGHLSLFRLGFSLSESWIFHEMPTEMRDGYKLAKIMKHNSVCPTIEGIEIGAYITTYMLKTCIFMEWDSVISEHTHVPTPEEVASQSKDTYLKSVMYWARRIYERLHVAFDKQELESFFIPGHNLLRDSNFVEHRERAMLYATVIKDLLMPTDQEIPAPLWILISISDLEGATGSEIPPKTNNSVCIPPSPPTAKMCTSPLVNSQPVCSTLGKSFRLSAHSPPKPEHGLLSPPCNATQQIPLKNLFQADKGPKINTDPTNAMALPPQNDVQLECVSSTDISVTHDMSANSTFDAQCLGCRSSICTSAGSEWLTCTSCVNVNICRECSVSGIHMHHKDQISVYRSPPQNSKSCTTCGYVFPKENKDYVVTTCSKCLNVQMCQRCTFSKYHSVHEEYLLRS